MPPRRCAVALTLASAFAVGDAAADESRAMQPGTQDPGASHLPFERRGLRRAGITLFTTGVSALPSSVALLATSEGRMGTAAALMAISGHVFMAAGIPMWVIGAQGRRTRPRNARLMYTGLVIAETGMALLPPSSALLVASLDAGADDEAVRRRRLVGFTTGAVGNAAIATGIPMWAYGAASPDDAFAQAIITLGPTGASLLAAF
jgi:hypothetical protein